MLCSDNINKAVSVEKLLITMCEHVSDKGVEWRKDQFAAKWPSTAYILGPIHAQNRRVRLQQPTETTL